MERRASPPGHENADADADERHMALPVTFRPVQAGAPDAQDDNWGSTDQLRRVPANPWAITVGSMRYRRARRSL